MTLWANWYPAVHVRLCDTLFEPLSVGVFTFGGHDPVEYGAVSWRLAREGATPRRLRLWT